MRYNRFLFVILYCKRGLGKIYLPSTILLSIALSMCKPSGAKEQMQHEGLEQGLIEKLVKKPLLTIDGNYSVFLDSDTLYLLNFGLERELSMHFQLQIILEDGSVVNQEIDQKEYDDQSVSMAELGITEIKKLPLFTNQFNSLIFDQYTQAEGNLQKKRRHTLSFQQLMGKGRQECMSETSDKQKALYNRIFQEHLNQGIFARIPSGYYLLLIHRTCYLITTKNKKNQPNVMLHFIRNDNGFDNYSFSVKEPSFENCLNQSNGLKIDRINLSKSFVEYKRIRIGEFGSSGNLWAQEFTIERLIENRLLCYDGEFNDRDKTE